MKVILEIKGNDEIRYDDIVEIQYGEIGGRSEWGGFRSENFNWGINIFSYCNYYWGCENLFQDIRLGQRGIMMIFI